MITDRDVWQAAKLLVDRHGQDATLHAAQRADELLGNGDIDGRAIWHLIEEACVELLRAEPGPGERVS